MQASGAVASSIGFLRRATCFVIAASVHVALLSVFVDIEAARDERVAPRAELRSVSALRVVFIESDSTNKPSAIAGLLAATLEVSIAAHFEATAPDITPLLADSFESSREPITADDVIEGQRLQKVYVGQISARLRRVIEELRTASSSPAACLVNVVQDERGSVLDVLMDQCEADTAWQDTVRRAIRQASPLPLPPQGLAMGSYLTLDVSSLLTQVARAEMTSR